MPSPGPGHLTPSITPSLTQAPSAVPVTPIKVTEPIPTVAKIAEVSVGLILGPGGTKTLAQIGVLRELERAQIPIRGVVGLEWGALIAGLFSSHGRTHDVEWQIAKLKASDLPSGGLIFGSGIQPIAINRIGVFLEQATVGRRTHEGKIPFSCPFVELESDAIQWADQGPLKDALTSCLPFPPVVEAKGRIAAPTSLRGAIGWLKSKGIQKVILVNVLPLGDLTKAHNYSGDDSLELLWREIRRQMRSETEGIDWLIDVSTKGHSFHEVENVRALIQLGSSVTTPQLPALKKRLGL